MARLSSWLHQLRLAAADDVLMREQMALDNLRQIRFGAALISGLYLVASALLLPQAWTPGSGVRMGWQLAVGLTHLGSALLTLVMGALAHRALTRQPHGRLARVLPVAVAVLTLLSGLVLTLFYQWVEPKTSPMALAALGVALLIYLRPVVAAALFLSLAAVGFALLPWTQHDPALLASARVSALAIPLTGLAFSVLSWRRNRLRILLARSLAQANEALALKQAELERMAWHDGLTGLCNRSEFMRRAGLELLRAQRHRHATSLLLLDLDDFKQVNDGWGHPVGDAVLCRIAALLQEQVRSSDLVARLGGEEFIVLLPETDLGAALQCAEKVRRAVQDAPLATGQGLVNITVSLGALAVPFDSGADMSRAYAAVDRALYRAKQAGRNRVEAGSLGAAVPDPGVTAAAR
jgi:diguanylate cyclase (GGDEF)-like protein